MLIAGLPQAPASHQYVASQDRQESFTPESRAPFAELDSPAQQSSTLDTADSITAVDSPAQEQNSHEQPVSYASMSV